MGGCSLSAPVQTRLTSEANKQNKGDAASRVLWRYYTVKGEWRPDSGARLPRQHPGRGAALATTTPPHPALAAGELILRLYWFTLTRSRHLCFLLVKFPRGQILRRSSALTFGKRPSAGHVNAVHATLPDSQRVLVPPTPTPRWMLHVSVSSSVALNVPPPLSCRLTCCDGSRRRPWAEAVSAST